MYKSWRDNIVTIINRAWNRSARFRLSHQWLKIIPHMTGSYYHCCFNHCVHLKLGHRFHALLKVDSDHDNIVHNVHDVCAMLYIWNKFDHEINWFVLNSFVYTILCLKNTHLGKTMKNTFLTVPFVNILVFFFCLTGGLLLLLSECNYTFCIY